MPVKEIILSPACYLKRNQLQGRADAFPVRRRKERSCGGETNKIVWSQLVELLSALEAMEIEQTGSGNILYLLDTVVLLSLSFLSEKR